MKAKPRTEYVEKENFISIFNNNCIISSYDKVPVFKVLTSEPILSGVWSTYASIQTDSDKNIIIYISYENYAKEGAINKVYIKNQKVDSILLNLFLQTLETFNTLTVLKLEYCYLSYTEIGNLQVILNKYQNIIDLSVDGNPNSSQNFQTLLIDTNLQYLSLARCNINHIGVDALSYQLADENTKLRMINLSGNRVDDIAVLHIAKALRRNRNLISLVLADNWITNVGCEALMAPLQKFQLNYNETVIKRNFRINYYKQKIALLKQYKSEYSNAELKNLDSQIKHNKSNKSFIKAYSLFTNLQRKSSLNETEKNRKIEQYIEKHIVKTNHPFMTESVEANGKTYCTGNFKLSHLNLAYNKINSVGYQYIINTLKYQINMKADSLNFGLLHLLLDGNLNEECMELNEIKILQQEQMLKYLNKDYKPYRRSASATTN